MRVRMRVRVCMCVGGGVKRGVVCRVGKRGASALWCTRAESLSVYATSCSYGKDIEFLEICLGFYQNFSGHPEAVVMVCVVWASMSKVGEEGSHCYCDDSLFWVLVAGWQAPILPDLLRQLGEHGNLEGVAVRVFGCLASLTFTMGQGWRPVVEVLPLVMPCTNTACAPCALSLPPPPHSSSMPPRTRPPAHVVLPGHAWTRLIVTAPTTVTTPTPCTVLVGS